MSEEIRHECGIALIRLLKPPEYFLSKYGTCLFGINKLHLMMQKQHNRGQDGAGIACVKLDMSPGEKYIDRFRSNRENPIKDIFSQVNEQFRQIVEKKPERMKDPGWLRHNAGFTGELFLGHLRYGTYGKYEIENLHPVMRENNWKTRNLVLAGNFNLTNVTELFEKLVEYGQYPVKTTDTITILEKIGHYLDEENELLYQQYKEEGHSKKEITSLIIDHLDPAKILRRSCSTWDGGYVMAGMIGHGDAFVLRDPSGIRPAFWYADDEVAVVASERPVIQTAFGAGADRVRELNPGHALIIRKNGMITEELCHEPAEKRSCSFERIYFSRGTDSSIYQERRALGKRLMPAILQAIDHDIENTVFSFIPNTALVAFMGLVEELRSFCSGVHKDKILQIKGHITADALDRIFRFRPRIDMIAVKDVKLRTFITQDSEREDLVGHVYDVTYGIVRPGVDNLVVLDDSIVRGTTLRQSIIRILDQLGPKRIVVASSAPQIRYPDCYGIDMARLGDFIAFRATIDLLRETGQKDLINKVYKKCKEQESKAATGMENYVKLLYQPFTPEQISGKISAMLTTQTTKAEVKIVYQTIGDLHEAVPGHMGDWYFTGDYPTPGGFKALNRSFINFIEKRNERAY